MGDTGERGGRRGRGDRPRALHSPDTTTTASEFTPQRSSAKRQQDMNRLFSSKQTTPMPQNAQNAQRNADYKRPKYSIKPPVSSRSRGEGNRSAGTSHKDPLSRLLVPCSPAVQSPTQPRNLHTALSKLLQRGGSNATPPNGARASEPHAHPMHEANSVVQPQALFASPAPNRRNHTDTQPTPPPPPTPAAAAAAASKEVVEDSQSEDEDEDDAAPWRRRAAQPVVDIQTPAGEYRHSHGGDDQQHEEEPVASGRGVDSHELRPSGLQAQRAFIANLPAISGSVDTGRTVRGTGLLAQLQRAQLADRALRSHWERGQRAGCLLATVLSTETEGSVVRTISSVTGDDGNTEEASQALSNCNAHSQYHS